MHQTYTEGTLAYTKDSYWWTSKIKHVHLVHGPEPSTKKHSQWQISLVSRRPVWETDLRDRSERQIPRVFADWWYFNRRRWHLPTCMSPLIQHLQITSFHRGGIRVWKIQLQQRSH